MTAIRLQKFLSQAGFCSRRKGEEFIQAGEVFVNGKVAKELGVSIDPEKDEIVIHQQRIKAPEQKHYYAFYKPRHLLVTEKDPQGRPIIWDQLTELPPSVHAVGRLDFDSEGLLLLTSDGELTHHLLHPKHHVWKTYHVKTKGLLSEKMIQQLRDGVALEDTKTAPAQIRVLKQTEHAMWLEIRLHEGKRRQIRRMLELFNVPVLRLIRVAVGPVTLEGLEKGQWRELAEDEIRSLKRK